MKSLGETGECLRALGRLDEAAAAYEASIQLADELGDRRGGAVARGNLGTVRMQQQRFDGTLSAHTEARKIFEQLGEPRSVAIGWHLVSRVCKGAGKLEEAEHACHQALKIRVQNGYRSGRAESLDQLGLLYSDMGALVPVLQEIVEGSRDPTLASNPRLFFMDAVEVTLLLERLG